MTEQLVKSDMMLMYTVLQAHGIRGKLPANEFSVYGKLFDKLHQILVAIQQTEEGKPGEAPPDIIGQDIAVMYQIFRDATVRGIYQPDELMNVAPVYEKIKKILAGLQEKAKAEAEAKAKAEADKSAPLETIKEEPAEVDKVIKPEDVTISGDATLKPEITAESDKKKE